MVTKSRRRLISATVRYMILSIWAIISFFPIYWMVSTSFKPVRNGFPGHRSIFRTRRRYRIT